MVLKTEVCRFSGLKIYPGHGMRLTKIDSQTYLFLSAKCKRLFNLRLRPAKLAWTTQYRKAHKKVRGVNALAMCRRRVGADWRRRRDVASSTPDPPSRVSFARDELFLGFPRTIADVLPPPSLVARARRTPWWTPRARRSAASGSKTAPSSARTSRCDSTRALAASDVHARGFFFPRRANGTGRSLREERRKEIFRRRPRAAAAP